MGKFKITVNGPLNDEITVSGTKNAILSLVCAGLLTAGTLHLKNVPMLADVRTTQKLLQGMSARVLTDNVHKFEVNSGTVNDICALYELVETMRVSILVLGPTLARFDETQVSLPDGCTIDSRPVDQHLKGLETMGAEITIEHDYIKAKGCLKGTRVVIDVVTVGDTGNLLMAAILAEGTTVLENCAIEPEAVDLVKYLVKMSTKISGIGTLVMTVERVEELHGCEHSVVPDRIKTGTFLCAVAMTDGKVVLHRTAPRTMEAVLEELTETDAVTEAGDDWISIDMKRWPKTVDIHTVVHPSFPTDMQVQLMVINATAEGNCHVIETTFENRFMHVPELNHVGASITTEGNTTYVKGVEIFSDATVMATDLRASVNLIIADLIAGGETIVERIYHLDRGYEHVEKKLGRVDARIERVSGWTAI